MGGIIMRRRSEQYCFAMVADLYGRAAREQVGADLHAPDRETHLPPVSASSIDGADAGAGKVRGSDARALMARGSRHLPLDQRLLLPLEAQADAHHLAASFQSHVCAHIRHAKNLQRVRYSRGALCHKPASADHG